MKKLISLILALAMVLSLAVPALAAEPTVTGGRSGDVSGSYAPVITVTDIVLSEFNGNGSVTVDEGNKTYTLNIPADADGVSVTVTVKGQNLDKITGNDYNVSFTEESMAPLREDMYNAAAGTMSCVVYVSATETAAALQYSTDGGKTWTKTDWSAVIRKEYTVSVNKYTGATLTVDKTTAAEDETVTVSAVVENGYRLDGVDVHVEGGGFSATKQEDGTYTFTMPAEDVAVQPNLTKLYAVNFGTIENGTVTAAPTQAGAWETVTLNVAAAQGYMLEKITVINDSTGGAVAVSEDHSFSMPASSVTVTASFVATTQTYGVSIAETVGGTVTVEKAYYAKGDTVTLTVTPEEGYRLRSLQYTDGEGNVTLISGSSFVMPESNVTVTAEFYKPAVITGLALVVDGQEHTSGTVTLKADSTATVKALGTDLNNANSQYWVYLGVSGEHLTEFTLDESNTFATAPLNLSNYSKGYTYELKYQNEGGEWICPGLFFKIAVEAKWGASKDNLTHAGTLADALAAAQADASIAYIQLQEDLTPDDTYNLFSGTFTLDLNGKTLSFADYGFVVDGAMVTVTDSATGGSLKSNDVVGITVSGGSKVVIRGGSYSGLNAVSVAEGGTVQIDGGSFKGTSMAIVNIGGELTINGGEFTASEAIYVNGDTTVNGGSFTAEDGDDFYYISGPLDLSGYTGAVAGLTLFYAGDADQVITDEILKLTNGFVLVDEQGNTVTTLVAHETYTIAPEVVKYTVSVNAAQNGTVTADKETAAQGETVTLTWTTQGKYALDSIIVEDAEGNQVTITDKGLTAWTFVMPESNVTVTAVFKEILTTSADISWGSLSFTYTDGDNGAEGAWSCAEGANKITVTNTGDNAFNIQPLYTAKEGYTEITGKFYESMEATQTTMFADLYSGDSFTFYLKLFNKPAQALTGDTIATVTIRIAEGIGE